MAGRRHMPVLLTVGTGGGFPDGGRATLTPQERAALETASTAIWKAIAVALHDRDHPAVRQRRAKPGR
jgi:hypothetical protein